MRGRPRTTDPLDAECLPPPDYGDGKWYTPEELRRVNKELAKVGRRICRTHQGAALPLTSEHFHYSNKAHGWLDTECKACQHERSRRRKLQRYHADPDYVSRLLEGQHQSITRREARRKRHAQERKQRFAAVLEERAS